MKQICKQVSKKVETIFKSTEFWKKVLKKCQSQLKTMERYAIKPKNKYAKMRKICS